MESGNLPPGYSEFVFVWPVYILVEGVNRSPNAVTLNLSKSTRVLASDTPNGKVMAVFTDADLAERFRECHDEGATFNAVALGVVEFMCVLARVGVTCDKMAIDPNPQTQFARLAPIESTRQQLSAKIQAAMAGMDL